MKSDAKPIKTKYHSKTDTIYLSVILLYSLKIIITRLYTGQPDFTAPGNHIDDYLLIILDIAVFLVLLSCFIKYAVNRITKNLLSITLAVYALILFLITSYDNVDGLITIVIAGILFLSGNTREEKKINIFFYTCFLFHAAIMAAQLTGVIPFLENGEYTRQTKLLECSKNILFQTLIFITLLTVNAYVKDKKERYKSKQEKIHSLITAYDFTPKQKETALLFLENKTTAEISKIMNIKENTIKTHKQEIYRKMGIKNQIEFLQRFKKI